MHAAWALFNIARPSHASTTALLQELNWELLADRHPNLRPAMFRTMHFGYTDVNPDIYVKPLNNIVITRSHNQQYTVSHYNHQSTHENIFC